MEYRSEIVIDLLWDRVVELFDSADNLFKWQPGLLEYKFLRGTRVGPAPRRA